MIWCLRGIWREGFRVLLDNTHVSLNSKFTRVELLASSSPRSLLHLNYQLAHAHFPAQALHETTSRAGG